MGEANKRGSFEVRRKLAIDRNAREAEEAARFERLRPRGKSSAKSILAVALAATAATQIFQERQRVEPKKEAGA